MKPILSISDLCISRDGTRILSNLNWTVRPGEQWVILGSNGSGKTSLLSALTGYLTPSSGVLSLLGQTFGESDWRKLRERVGIVSSSIRQKVPDWDPAELVVIGGKYAMLDYWGPLRRADRATAAEVMKRTECAHLASREWGVLSQGERQRVLIARALMANPAVLILDEPCAGLDPVAREGFLAFLERLLSSPDAPTVLFVTHHVEEIVPSLTHTLLLAGGTVSASGPKAAVINTRNLSQTFGASVKLRRTGDRYLLNITRGE